MTSTTGTAAVAGFSFSLAMRSNPPITGIMTSTKMMSGISSLTRCMAISPLIIPKPRSPSEPSGGCSSREQLTLERRLLGLCRPFLEVGLTWLDPGMGNKKAPSTEETTDIRIRRAKKSATRTFLITLRYSSMRRW